MFYIMFIDIYLGFIALLGRVEALFWFLVSPRSLGSIISGPQGAASREGQLGGAQLLPSLQPGSRESKRKLLGTTHHPRAYLDD